MIIDGKQIAKDIKEQCKEKVALLEDKPTLCIISVGDDEASKVYMRNKKLACEYVGINCIHKSFREDISEEDLLEEIKVANNSRIIDGIICQLPLPKHIRESAVINTIVATKDVDGFRKDSAYDPCTPAGIIELIKRSGVEIEGKHAVVIGRSNIVGKPVARLLLDNNATVTVCHSKTKNLSYYTKQADILVVAVGKLK